MTYTRSPKKEMGAASLGPLSFCDPKEQPFTVQESPAGFASLAVPQFPPLFRRATYFYDWYLVANHCPVVARFCGLSASKSCGVQIYGEVAFDTGIVSSVRDSDSKSTRTAFTDVFVRRARNRLAVNAQELPLEPEPKP